MLTLFVALFLTLVSLIVLLWVGTFLFQGYIYTEPTQGLFWQAPATAAILALGYTFWCLTVVFSARASTTNIPVNTIFRFTPWEDMLDQPAPRVFAIKKSATKSNEGKDGDVVAYVAKKDDQGRTLYKDTTIRQRPWLSQDVIAIEIEKPDATKARFNLVKDDAGGQFISSDGWVMPEDKNGAPTGIPKKFHFVRLILNIVFNVVHFFAWYITLWLLLRFQSLHAFGLAIIFWLAATLILLPMILATAGEVAMSRQTRVALEWILPPLAV